ncbi:unnamed protein product [Schistocephalus solidus]|uniref:Ferritin-like domain-containing protein n=1 Tax=Schistocephalus solidus TaxID=70667 RepID=A0A183T5G8_SCHSO|nr:unnamed protein product [Schistocephalus solidus]
MKIGSKRLELITAVVAQELAHYKLAITAFSDARVSEQIRLEEAAAGYTFIWSGRTIAEQGDAGTYDLPPLMTCSDEVENKCYEGLHSLLSFQTWTNWLHSVLLTPVSRESTLLRTNVEEIFCLADYTNTDVLIRKFDNAHPSLTFSVEFEVDNEIAFLDRLLHMQEDVAIHSQDPSPSYVWELKTDSY